PGNDLEEFEVTGWIEKMGATKMFLKILASALAHEFDGDPRCVGGDQSARLPVFVQVFQDLLFDIQSFHDHFDDPIHSCHLGYIILQVSGGDTVGKFWVVDRGGL